MPFPIPVFDAQTIVLDDGREYIAGESTFTSSVKAGEQLTFSLYRLSVDSDTPVLIRTLNPGDRIQQFNIESGKPTYVIVSTNGNVPEFTDRANTGDREDDDYFMYVGEGGVFSNQALPGDLPFATYWGEVEPNGITASLGTVQVLVNKVSTSLAGPDLIATNSASAPILNTILAPNIPFSAAVLFSTESLTNFTLSQSSSILADYITSGSYQTWCVFSVHSASAKDFFDLSKNNRIFGSSDGRWGFYIGQSDSHNFFNIYGVHSADGNLFESFTTQLTGTYDALHVVKFTHDRNRQSGDIADGFSIAIDNGPSASFGGNDFIVPLTSSTLSSSLVVGADDSSDWTVTELVIANSQSSPAYEFAVDNYFSNKYSFVPFSEVLGPSASFPTELSGVTFWGRMDNVTTTTFGGEVRVDIIPNKITGSPGISDYTLDGAGSGFSLAVTGTVDRRKAIRFFNNAPATQFYTGLSGATPLNVSDFVGNPVENYHYFAVFRVRSGNMPQVPETPQEGQILIGMDRTTGESKTWGLFLRAPTTASIVSGVNYDYELNAFHKSGIVSGSTQHMLKFGSLYFIEVAHSGTTFRSRVNDGPIREARKKPTNAANNILYFGMQDLTLGLNADVHEVIFANTWSSGSTEHERVRNYLSSSYFYSQLPVQPDPPPAPLKNPAVVVSGTYWGDADTVVTGIDSLSNTVVTEMSNKFTGSFATMTFINSNADDSPLLINDPLSGQNAIQMLEDFTVTSSADLDGRFLIGSGTMDAQGKLIDILGNHASGSTSWHLWIVYSIPNVIPLDSAGLITNNGTISFNHALFSIRPFFGASPDFRNWGLHLDDSGIEGRWDAPVYSATHEGPTAASILASQRAYNNGLFLVELRYPSDAGRVERVLCRTGSFAPPDTSNNGLAIDPLSSSLPGSPLFEDVYIGQPGAAFNTRFWPGNVVEIVTSAVTQSVEVRNRMFEYFEEKYGFNIPTIV